MRLPKLPNSTYDTQDTARLAFMLKLVDTLHSMPDAFAIEDFACRQLAENLPVEFAWFAEIGPGKQQITIRSEFTRDRSVRLAGVYPVEQLQSLVRIIRADQPCIIDDTFQSFNTESPERSFYEDHRIRSCLAFPVANGKQVLTYIAIANDIPHHWTAREVSLVHETAVRIGDAIRLTEHGGHRRIITQRRRDEEALRKNEQRLSLALTSAKMGAFEWNSEGQQLTLSEFSKEVFGLIPGEEFHTSDAYSNLIHSDDRQRHQQVFEHASTSGEDYQCIYRIIRPVDGITAWIEECGCGYKDDRTGTTSIVGILRDVTQRVPACGQLLQKQLEEVQDERANLIQKLNSQVSRLHKLIRDLLDTTRSGQKQTG